MGSTTSAPEKQALLWAEKNSTIPFSYKIIRLCNLEMENRDITHAQASKRNPDTHFLLNIKRNIHESPVYIPASGRRIFLQVLKFLHQEGRKDNRGGSCNEAIGADVAP